MESRQLKVNDWVRWMHEPVKVVGIEPHYINVVDTRDEYVPNLCIASVEPIPITEKLLFNNGWHDGNKYHEWRNPTMPQYCLCKWYGASTGTEYWSFGVGTDSIYLYDIQYVHELQNILSALGENDNIVID